MLQLANSDKYICVNEWQGTLRIHIRTHFNSNGSGHGGGELIPTKKGVALTIEEWKALKAHMDHVDALIAFAEDERIINKPEANTPAPPPPTNLIPEVCQYRPPNAATIARQLSQIRKATPYQQSYEPEPFDQ